MASIATFDEWQNSAGLKHNTVLRVTSGSAVPGVVTTSSTSYVDTGIIEVAITPRALNSKIDIYMGGFQAHINPQATNYSGSMHIYRSVAGGAYAPVNGSTTSGLWGIYRNSQSGDAWDDFIATMQYLDSPTYTLGQEIKYRAFFRQGTRNGSGGAFYASHTGGISSFNGGTTNVIGIAKEIAS
jgi:hypothetical protein